MKTNRICNATFKLRDSKARNVNQLETGYSFKSEVDENGGIPHVWREPEIKSDTAIRNEIPLSYYCLLESCSLASAEERVWVFTLIKTNED
ncbi:hypothetical protein CEXT_31301 [Caerostris extrusa]|uniref:Uncharacterized protein n=1 Tax=Caerostris extrusa TaxID=172846 RepID=A0AAV4MY76_CAEEX|nr:hypothetical protein CEXT_31301 [Caerostris extrusa]